MSDQAKQAVFLLSFFREDRLQGGGGMEAYCGWKVEADLQHWR